MIDQVAGASAEQVVAATLAVPGVAGMHSGPFGEVATYLPGHRIGGVRLTPEVTEVHVVLQWGAAIQPTAAAIRRAVGPLVNTPVAVTIEDVRVDTGPADDPRSALTTARTVRR